MDHRITIVGLGPGSPGMLTVEALKRLKESGCIYLRTRVHPVADWLADQGFVFRTFDHVYEEAADFQEVYRLIAQEVISLAAEKEVLYAVPGHPLVAEESVELIRSYAAGAGLGVKVVPGMSFLDVLCSTLEIGEGEKLNVQDGLDLDSGKIDPSLPMVIIQAYKRSVLSDIKLTLMERYPDEHRLTVVTAAGVEDMEKVEQCMLFELDRVKIVNHLTSIYVPPSAVPVKLRHISYPLDRLVEIMSDLRGDRGCPWDREQTHETLKKYVLEEAYEVVGAINSGEMYNICEELGDLLLQIVFHAQIARENGAFDINDVVRVISEKMIRRHPHIFGSAKVNNSCEVVFNWDKIKEKEKKDRGCQDSIQDRIAGHLPALMRAQEMQSIASKAGFDWPDYHGPLAKVYEELEELKEAVAVNDKEHLNAELGDVFFAVVNLSRILGIDAETALVSSAEKFARRFAYVEKKAGDLERELSGCSLDEMDKWWEEAKKCEKA